MIRYPRFDNPKDALKYLKEKAKDGEIIILDERATGSRKRRINRFRCKLKSSEEKT